MCGMQMHFLTLVFDQEERAHYKHTLSSEYAHHTSYHYLRIFLRGAEYMSVFTYVCDTCSKNQWILWPPQLGFAFGK